MVNFDNLLTKMENLEKDGKLLDALLVLSKAAEQRPNAIRSSMQIEDFIRHSSWVQEPKLLINILDTYRVEQNTNQNKDFLNRKILSLLGEFIADEEFWFVVCLKYPNYAKFYKNASEEFKTAIRIVS